MKSYRDYFNKERQRIIKEWMEFLRFRSISTDPAYHNDCVKCADWVRQHLQSMGFQAELLQTKSKPVVWATKAGEHNKPRVLYYGHYDVQPVDPIELWESDPFEPVEKGGRLYARGAQDNKGQTFYTFKAIEALAKLNTLKCPISILLEGEEESGSKGLHDSMAGWQGRLQSDVLLVCDTGGFAAGKPWVTMGLRGLVWCEIKLGGLTHDLHSGALGGVVKNPAIELARLLSTLHDDQGKIAIEGYYDEVKLPSASDRTLANEFTLPDEAIQAMLGVPPVGGEKGFTLNERRGFRPTVEVNGLFSGYSGPGTKTIIPASASAKLTCRLVPDQNPSRCLELLIKHLQAHVPPGVKLQIVDQGIGGGPLALSSETPLIQKVKDALGQLGAGPAQFIWEGGSIPIVTDLSKVAGAKPLLVGFGLEEDHIHAPNESFMLSQFELGFLSICSILELLSNTSEV